MNFRLGNSIRLGMVYSYLLTLLTLCWVAPGNANDALERSLILSFDGTDDIGATLHTQFATPDYVPGVQGLAWRTDGFSSRAEITTDRSLHHGFTLSFWVALESYPSDLEVPVNQLSPSSIVRQGQTGAFDVWIDAYGRWGVKLRDVDGNEKNLQAVDKFPLQAWTLLTLTHDAATGQFVVMLNQDTVLEADIGSAGLKMSSAPLILAWPEQTVEFLVFTFNGLNAAYDELLLGLPESSAATQERYQQVVNGAAPIWDSLSVPDSRFKGDHLRPLFHAMPPANWTNEPHGLVRKNGTWHLFYQRTPNGPYKTLMHWGHMSSDDLITWRHHPDALYPELQTDDFGFDQKGIWSGDVIVEGDTAIAFYTSVNHKPRLSAANPGISMAVSTDPTLDIWKKLGPNIDTRYVKDFRDPYLWREGSSWHMIIGAATEHGGGLDYYKFDHTAPDEGWQHQKRFLEISSRVLDIGSIIWEMPVFEPLGDGTHILVVNPIGGAVSKYGDPATRGIYWRGTWRDGNFEPFEKSPKLLDVLPGHLSPTVARGDDNQLRAIGIVDERRTSEAQLRAGWAHTFSLPRRWFPLSDGLTLGQAPAPELEALREFSAPQTHTFSATGSIDLAPTANQWELLVELADNPEQCIDIQLAKSESGSFFTRLVIDGSGDVTFDRQRSNGRGDDEGPLLITGNYEPAAHGPLSSIHLFFDGSVADVFINESAAFSVRTYPHAAVDTGVRVTSCAAATGGQLAFWPLRSTGE